MSASLVGSEMCIRDRSRLASRVAAAPATTAALSVASSRVGLRSSASGCSRSPIARSSACSRAG
eukprot:3340608-Alexandrium_andersonii.AAC.1